MSGDKCPLCDSLDAALLHTDAQRHYLNCANCALIFVPVAQRLDAAAEKARYDLHRNDPNDCEYRKFLARLGDQVMARLPGGAEGLDFGCGPGPALAAMLTENGYPTAVYDPYYAPDETVWRRRYDFITSSEVLEHLYHPAAELKRLFLAIKPGGILGVMTSFAPELTEFARWHYINDPTHVCFYSAQTFAYIARRWGAAIIHMADNVVVMRKM